MHVMLQREVVERMTAPPGGKDYGRLTVMLALWVRAEACFDIGPGAFTPPPKVWSTVVRLVPHAAPPFPVQDHARFARLVAQLFSMRRKTLGRSLKGWLTPEQIAGGRHRSQGAARDAGTGRLRAPRGALDPNWRAEAACDAA